MFFIFILGRELDYRLSYYIGVPLPFAKALEVSKVVGFVRLKPRFDFYFLYGSFGSRHFDHFAGYLLALLLHRNI